MKYQKEKFKKLEGLQEKKDLRPLTVADFFCGAGGFSEGFRQMGFEIVFALDNWGPAINTHHLNHPKSNSVLMDILKLNTPEKIDKVVPDTDIIIGSPPCISFSNSNRSGKADKTLGLKLIKAFLRIVAWKKKKGVLKYWIMENVPNSEKYTKENYLWKELNLPGKGPKLNVEIRKIMNSANYGVPQLRKRFISGDFPIPKPKFKLENHITVKEILKNLGNPLGNKDYKIKDPLYGFEIDSKSLTDHFYDNRVAKFEWIKARELKKDHGYMGKMSFPENIERPSRTVMATISPSTRESMILCSFDKRGKKNGYRLPTVRESACFMSFPINYMFEGLSESIKYRLVGNAVCPKFSAELAREILKKEGIKFKSNNGFKIVDMPKVNLNGSKRTIKKIKKKRYDSRFSQHVPYLKIRNYRVSLENLKSDFKNSEIIWNAVLHHGTGKDAKKLELDNSISKKLSSGTKEMKDFHKDLLKLFNNYKFNHKTLHEEYLQNDNLKGPKMILSEIKKIIDKHFPENIWSSKEIDHRERGVNIGNGTMPLRIIAAISACNLFISTL